MAVESYVAWYRKYRPSTMDDYKGQKVRDIVMKRFTKPESRPQTVMIYGERGCGKTTFARIISKYYLCTNPNKDGTPCECCEMCNEINESLINAGESIDSTAVTEIDATLANKKDDIQAILDEAMVEPLYSKYKILVFDECHMISKAAQNSLLKTLEDIPKHLIVIMATTDPDQVLPTIHSRCQVKIEVRKQTIKDMAERLMEISKKEGLTVSKEALELIAKKGDRVPRECINLLEDVAKNNDGNVTVKTVQNLKGDVPSELYVEYIEASNKSLEEILIFIRSLREKGVQYKDFMKGLSRFVMDSLYVKHGVALGDYTKEFVDQIKELFRLYKSSDFDMLLQIIEKACTDVSNDESQSELLLTLTSLRISKIDLLANGLSDEETEAVEENKGSLQAHSDYIESTRNKLVEDLKESIGNDEELREDFTELEKTSISDELSHIMESMEIPDIKECQESEDSSADDDILDSIDL